MRTETTTRTLYKLNELSQDAQDKAIESLWDINVDYEWWEWAFDDAERIDLRISEFDLDRSSYVKADFLESAEQTAHKIIDKHGNTFDTYRTAETYLSDRDELIATAPRDADGEFENEFKLDSDLDSLDEDFLHSLCEDYRIVLTREYEYLTSREAIVETIDANEYEFTATGELS